MSSTVHSSTGARPDLRVVRFASTIPAAASAVAVTVGCLVLFGYWADIEILKSALPGKVMRRMDLLRGLG